VPTERVTARGAHGPHQVLFVHGSGYQIGSPTSHRGFAAHLSRATGAPVHLPHYRRAPEHPYPAAVDDVEAAYRALRAGDIQHNASHWRVIPLAPESSWPWRCGCGTRARSCREPSDWCPRGSTWTSARRTCARTPATDAMLSAGRLGPASHAYLAGTSPAPAELRPLEADLAGLPPVHVVAGGGEILVGDADALVARIRAAGGRVTYRRAARMWHDYVLVAGMLSDADTAVAELGAALRRACSGARRPRVAVVEAGFGGIGMGLALRAARRTGREDLAVVDPAGGVGGVRRATPTRGPRATCRRASTPSPPRPATGGTAGSPRRPTS
jgi:acetyl esterase/lipase